MTHADQVAVGDASADHPSPHRHRIGRATLLFGLAAAPLAWTAQIIVNDIIAANRCAGLAQGETVGGTAWAVMLAIDAAAVIVSLCAALLAWRSWRRTQRESGGEEEALLDRGEGRARFMAMAGMMVSLGFLGATLAVGAVLFVVPLCAG